MSDNTSMLPEGMLLRIIQQKHDILTYYKELHNLSEDESMSALIKEILMDEETHLTMFSNLYVDLFGTRPATEPVPMPLEPIMDSIRKAIKMEFYNYNMYNNIFFTDSQQNVRDTFLKAFCDENIHASKFNYLLSVFGV